MMEVKGKGGKGTETASEELTDLCVRGTPVS
jgi:hypothetical protein